MTKSEYDDYVARVKAFFEREGLNCLTTVSDNALGEVEPYFSWAKCACCQSTLGGNRYDCAGYNPVTRLAQDGYSVCTDCVYYAEYGQLDDMTMLEVAQDEERIYDEDNARVRKMTDAYITCAFWSSTDESDDSGGEPLDRNYGAHNIGDTDRYSMQSDCLKFYQANKADLELFAEAIDNATDRDGWEECGHCFWLSRNGHGAGFFDRFMVSAGDSEELETLGDRLQEAAKAFGEASLYIGDDDGLYYFTG